MIVSNKSYLPKSVLFLVKNHLIQYYASRSVPHGTGLNQKKPYSRVLEYKTLQDVSWRGVEPRDSLFLRWSNVIASQAFSPNNKRQSAVLKWKSEHSKAFTLTLLFRLCLYRQINVETWILLKSMPYNSWNLEWDLAKVLNIYYAGYRIRFWIPFVFCIFSYYRRIHFKEKRYYHEQILMMLVSPSGIEPVTFWLRGGIDTDELPSGQHTYNYYLQPFIH